VSDAKQLVLAATDIVQLIGRTVGLRKRGKDYVGLCPFHQEKSPSFAVNPEKQVFYCYGCKKGGNAIQFVMDRDRVEFRDALKILADEARIELPSFGNKEKHGERLQLLDAQLAAQKVFRRLLLLDSRGKPAREYLRKRGFTDATLDAFAVGYAADAWDVLATAPEMKNFAPPMLAGAGLLKAREQGNGFYDTFRDRVMFPIRDETGKTIAFGGRVLPGSDNPAKYLNSPETPLFSKSRCAYGIDQARQRIVETRTAVIVEGYTDVLMAHQYDVKNVVSVLGTALTEQHVSLLRRFADRIVLLFDADTAGAGAADRSLELFLTQPIEIAIATLPEGRDPDEVLLEQGKPGFEGVIARATPALEYLWARLFA
jgi:DNA primase